MNFNIVVLLVSWFEMDAFCWNCILITSGQLSSRTPVVSASGQMICHRFYYYYSFTKCHPFFSMFGKLHSFLVSMACVLIASKIEEELFPISRLIKIFFPLYLHRTGREYFEINETDEVSILIRLHPRSIPFGAPFSWSARNWFFPYSAIIYMEWPITLIDTFSFS